MRDEVLDRWRHLCQEAAAEQDPHHLLQLTREIVAMLTEKERQLTQQRMKKPNGTRPESLGVF